MTVLIGAMESFGAIQGNFLTDK